LEFCIVIQMEKNTKLFSDNRSELSEPDYIYSIFLAKRKIQMCNKTPPDSCPPDSVIEGLSSDWLFVNYLLADSLPLTWDDVSRPNQITNRRRALLANQRRKRRDLPLPSWEKNIASWKFLRMGHFSGVEESAERGSVVVGEHICGSAQSVQTAQSVVLHQKVKQTSLRFFLYMWNKENSYKLKQEVLLDQCCLHLVKWSIKSLCAHFTTVAMSD